MEYSNQEIEIIYQMKRSIVNEFRYHYNSTDINSLPNFIEPDWTISVKRLQVAFLIGMSTQEKKIIRKYKWMDMFNQALVELFSEEIINFIDSKTIVMTSKGENMFINPCRWYTKID